MHPFRRQRLLAFALLCGLAYPHYAVAQEPKAAKQASSSSHVEQNPDAATLLPVGIIKVEAVRLEPSPRLAKLGVKMQEGIKRHQQWFLQQVQKAKPGQPVPYDPKLGLTASEYKELLAAFPAQMQLHKVGEGTLTIKAEGTKRIFDGGADLEDFTGIEVDLQNLTVTTPYGLLKNGDPFTANKGQAAIGMWDGLRWKLESHVNIKDLAKVSATIIEFEVGKIKQNGRGQLHYRVQKVEQGKPVVGMEYFLRYDLPTVTRRLPASAHR